MDNRLTFLPNLANMVTHNAMRKKKLCSKLFFRVFTKTKHGMREKQNDTFYSVLFLCFYCPSLDFLRKGTRVEGKTK